MTERLANNSIESTLKNTLFFTKLCTGFLIVIFLILLWLLIQQITKGKSQFIPMAKLFCEIGENRCRLRLLYNLHNHLHEE
ncbi:hypothetical protein SNEBB_000480 [Seison nebaliae]|nr:hypothetical protein SNEBB_000480 [Seison nebaliae]